MNKVYIFGHKNPDTDTICSALAYAELKQAGGLDAVAVRLGEINNETRFILKYFDVTEPMPLHTIKTQVLDLDIDEAVCVNPSTSVRAAWELMKRHAKKTLAVVDPSKKLVGVATLSDITGAFMDTTDKELLSASRTSFSNIIETLNAKTILGTPELHVVTGHILIAAQHHSRIKDFVGKNDIVIANITENIHEAVLSGARLIICTCGLYPGENDIRIASKNNCVIISTEYDTFTSAMLIRQSVRVGYVMTTGNITTVGLDEFKDDVKERMLKTRYRSYPVVDKDNKVVGMISRYHLLSKKRKQAILVDHNEKNQTVKGIEEAEILEIIDHHRLGDIQTSNPILMKNEPVGSTATIIASIYRTQKANIPPKTAGILLSAILSDTLNFQSPTSTGQDTKTAQWLAQIADVDINDLALKIINAGSTLRGKTPDEIINGDMKGYTIGKHKIGIAQVYSIDSENLTDMKAGLMDRMQYYCDKNGLSLLMLLVTDLNRKGSTVLLAGERQDIFFKAYPHATSDNSIFLPGVLSRKKQVVPLIMSLEDEI